MTAAAQIREDMAARIAELSAIPADPVERAELRARHAREITGPQDTEAVCWMCGAVRSLADMRPAGGGEFACAWEHQGDCIKRAADLQYEDEQFEHYAALGREDTGGI